MPDHLHFIVQIPSGGRGATALPGVITNFKHLLSARYAIRFQRDFFDTRIRDDAHFAEKYNYILGNPVRKGLCATPSDWPYSIAFSRESTPVGRDDSVAWVGRDDPIASVGRDDPIAPYDRRDVVAKKQTNREPNEME